MRRHAGFRRPTEVVNLCLSMLECLLLGLSVLLVAQVARLTEKLKRGNQWHFFISHFQAGLDEGILSFSLSNSRLYGKSIYKNKRQERMKDCPHLHTGEALLDSLGAAAGRRLQTVAAGFDEGLPPLSPPSSHSLWRTPTVKTSAGDEWRTAPVRAQARTASVAQAQAMVGRQRAGGASHRRWSH